MEKAISREILYEYHNFNKLFISYRDISILWFWIEIFQDNKPISFYKKLNPAHYDYTTTGSKLLKIVDTNINSWSANKSIYSP